MNLFDDPLARVFRGLRGGDQLAFLSGAGLFVWKLLRRKRQSGRQLLYRGRVRPGSTVVVRAHRGRRARVEIRQTPLEE